MHFAHAAETQPSVEYAAPADAPRGESAAATCGQGWVHRHPTADPPARHRPAPPSPSPPLPAPRSAQPAPLECELQRRPARQLGAAALRPQPYTAAAQPPAALSRQPVPAPSLESPSLSLAPRESPALETKGTRQESAVLRCCARPPTSAAPPASPAARVARTAPNVTCR